MEISKSEFEKSLPMIKEALVDADFISIDAEFTGLTPPNVNMLHTDDLAQRYQKIKKCIQEFSIIQYGVCAFKRNEKGDFIAKPFNFFIFGNDTDTVQSRRVFTSQASSLAFLRSNKFDFNKLIDNGIPFYNYTEENTFVSSIQGTSMINRKSLINESTLTLSGKSFLSHNRNSIQKWLQGNTERPLVLQVNTAFYKKLIYQEITEKYNGYLSASQRDSKHIQIVRLKEEEKREREKKVTSPTLNFRAVIELIKEAKCPVVAHNAALDIFHTVDQFWEYLPDTIEQFKDTVNSMWDNIVDTKYLAQHHPSLQGCFHSSVLGSLYNTVSDEFQKAGQVISMAPGFDRYTNDENKIEHEAGYDAYMTGVVYLAFMMFISEEKEEKDTTEEKVNTTENATKEESNDYDSDRESDEDSGEESGEISDKEDDNSSKKKNNSLFINESLLKHYGRLFLMKSDMPYINLKGKEEVLIPNCPNKFFLQNIPTGLTNTGIEKIYPTVQPAAVSWVNENSAWLILKDETKIPFVKLGSLGLTTIQSFLPGASREVEGKAYGITKEAGGIEIITHERWAEVYGPKKTVSYETIASTLASSVQSDNIPSGAPSFSDIDIPVSTKRQREDDVEERSPKAQKNN